MRIFYFLLVLVIPISLNSQVVGDVITTDSLRKMEDFFTKRLGVDFYIQCKQRLGADNDGYLDQVWFLYLPNKSETINYLLFKKNDNKRFLLTKSSQLAKTSAGFVFEFTKKFSEEIESRKCWHYTRETSMNHLNVGTSKYDVKYSSDEWILTLVEKDEGNSYVYSSGYKHRIFNKCLGLFKNIKQRKIFNRFSENIMREF